MKIEKVFSAHSCRAEAARTINCYGVFEYCYLHLNSLANLNLRRRPKPVISSCPDYDESKYKVIDNLNIKHKCNNISVFDSAEKKITQVIVSKE